ncbi:MAG: TIGR04076 family protein [Desulfitobacteriaceae bacterium]|nr:TIGR04076 family protein [Desulfitobacteriaceae bacterium]MDI6913220.1 TIGR04076 family protein [Desulfitobacteriaceae bacterium]
MKKVELSVKSVKGFCSAGYKTGDKLTYTEPSVITADGVPVCIYAFNALAPYLSAYGKQTDPSDWINEINELQCPDPINTVVFGLKCIE